MPQISNKHLDPGMLTYLMGSSIIIVFQVHKLYNKIH